MSKFSSQVLSKRAREDVAGLQLPQMKKARLLKNNIRGGDKGRRLTAHSRGTTAFPFRTRIWDKLVEMIRYSRCPCHCH